MRSFASFIDSFWSMHVVCWVVGSFEVSSGKLNPTNGTVRVLWVHCAQTPPWSVPVLVVGMDWSQAIPFSGSYVGDRARGGRGEMPGHVLDVTARLFNDTVPVLYAT